MGTKSPVPHNSDTSGKNKPVTVSQGRTRKAVAPEQLTVQIPRGSAKPLRVRRDFYDIERPIHQIIPIVFGAIAIFLAICFFIPDSGAIVGDLLRQFFFGIVGRITSSLVPVALLLFAFSWRQSIRNHCLISRIVMVVLMLFLLSCFVRTVTASTEVIRVYNIADAFTHGNKIDGGGVVGNTLSFILVNLIAKVGTFIFCIVIILVFGVVCFGFTPSVIAERVRDRAAARAMEKVERRRILREERAAQNEDFRQQKQEMRMDAQRARIAQKTEERRQKYEDKLEQKRERDQKREEDRLERDKLAAQIKADRKKRQAHFRNEFDIAIEDDPAVTIADHADQPDRTDDATWEAADTDADGCVTTRRADEILHGIDTVTDTADGDETIPTPDLEALTERISNTASSVAKVTSFPLHIPETQSSGKTEKSTVPMTPPSASVRQTVPTNREQAPVETDYTGNTETPAAAAFTPPPDPSKPLVTEDMISTKTRIVAQDKPADTALTPEEEEREREKQALEEMYATYTFPPYSLLSPSEETNTGNITEEINQNARKLVETLTSFNVRTQITSVSRGPRITRYELVPEAGIRIRSIANLIDDISMNLATAGIRIEAPIPGKSAVGVEVPNKTASTVRLRELVETDLFKNAGPRTTVCIGADVTGDPVFCDLAKMPHMLIAGATGMGKSVCMNTIITSILYKARPDEVKLILVDPKKVELGVYNGIPHLLVPVVIDPKKAAGALSWAVCEMERRFDLIEDAGVRDLKGYNKELEAHPEREKLPHIIIIIDELNDLMMVASDAVEASICRIAQKARAAGIHLLIGTQRPSVDVITGTIKANIPSRIAFHVASQIDSRTILDAAGAEKLLNNGDMLFYPVGVPKPMRVQGAFISDGEVEKITSFLKQNIPTETYSRDVMADIERETEKCTQNGKKAAGDDAPAGDEERDETLSNPKFREAVEVAIDEGKISTSLIQRRLKLGFGKAARFIDIMQRMGIVSEPDGQKPRTTLITRDQYYDMLSRLDDDHQSE